MSILGISKGILEKTFLVCRIFGILSGFCDHKVKSKMFIEKKLRLKIVDYYQNY